jgi:hypothetical protein
MQNTVSIKGQIAVPDTIPLTGLSADADARVRSSKFP